MSDTSTEAYYRALSRCMEDSLRSWKEEYASSMSIEEFATQALTSWSIEATAYPGGRATVVTTVRGRKQYNDETHIFTLKRGGPKDWRRTSSSLPST